MIKVKATITYRISYIEKTERKIAIWCESALRELRLEQITLLTDTRCVARSAFEIGGAYSICNEGVWKDISQAQKRRDERYRRWR